MDPKLFNSLVSELSLATGTDLSVEARVVWLGLLGDIDDDRLKAGFRRACLECKAFPSVALIAEFAGEAEFGRLQPIADAWARVRAAVVRFSIYEPGKAEASLGPLLWRAICGPAGWADLCNMREGEASAYFAQFRDRYKELVAGEQRSRVLPDGLMPLTDDTPRRAIHADDRPKRALPPPVIKRPTLEQVEAAKKRLAEAKALREKPRQTPEETSRILDASVRFLERKIAADVRSRC